LTGARLPERELRPKIAADYRLLPNASDYLLPESWE